MPILLAINFQRGTRQEAICSGEWFGDGGEDNTTLRERRRRADAPVTRKRLCNDRRPPLTPAILDLCERGQSRVLTQFKKSEKFGRW
jgi:hypothetical protein